MHPVDCDQRLERGHIEVGCDFCGQHYDYDKVDCAQLFATDAPFDADIAMAALVKGGAPTGISAERIELTKP